MDRALAADLNVPTLEPSDTAVDGRWSPSIHHPAVARAVRPEQAVGRERWSRFPNGWILDGGLRAFREDRAYAGRSTAALKMLAVVIVTADRQRFGAPDYGLASQLTYDDLSRLAGLSQPLALSAKKFLSAQGVVEVTRGASSGQTVYRLKGRLCASGSVHHMGPVAEAATSGIAALRKLSCRQASGLRALKIYMLLSGLRREDTKTVVTSQAEIVRLAGLHEIHVEGALRELARRKMIAADLRAIRRCAEADRFTVRTCPL